MTAALIDGKAEAGLLLDEITHAVENLRAKGQRIPGLAVILVGEDPASQIYVRKKREDCAQVGFTSQAHLLSAQTTQHELLDLIDRLNADDTVDGILVQLPVPQHIDTETVIERISPTKDVDGFHPYNVGRLSLRLPTLRPCTPYGIIHLLDRAGETYKGRHATVVGASNIVGRPMALELLLAGATVTICHRFTRNLRPYVESADILVVGVGKRGIVNSDWIKPGATVIDVGMHRDKSGRVTGDLEFATARERAGKITPVPGGVGPMTRAMLLQNTLSAYTRRQRSPE
ncbi:bifunctional methylenetetrahydrofolate dehydrogenase/methenyltetrahydrofolate cyclohydrolase FolD [Acidihalobacter ferrooxydans]|uniref:Bifunctional protein FolD n=1 Tax=Acidihalobacter ferrooxydans TaxID=1765967 RepID=A0A1P8UFS9_9GAMM|nr:bifunctional methylenetetrahydrofolate dehydrogenase/methenyltetrahydrofolate cyclohydrolase FolD [Acidihalobacter ferrooxydans]APZ42688.1 bifunctional methylenetetrahydrofolate dehydrogenase/methenyltetrahydrofolate cyclohydrolase [Acidihalobacter ferrooxydans]